MTLTRRRFLLATGASAVGLGAGAAYYERHRLEDTLDPPHGRVPGGSTGPQRSGTFLSVARRRTVRWEVAWPPGSRPGDRLAVALVLHGRGDDSRAAFGAQGLQHFLGAAVRAGTPPFALAAIDGGDHTYWHARADGDDPQTMLTQEFVPLLSRMGLRGDRFALTGWSMGGYGALLLAARTPGRVLAVATDAAALWQRPGDTAQGAFDGPADFARNDVFTMAYRLSGLPLRLSCGRSDPFAGANHALVTALPSAQHNFPRGGHDIGCWNTMRLADMTFLGEHLSVR
jgi:enterochelin esterase-like enzyme